MKKQVNLKSLKKSSLTTFVKSLWNYCEVKFLIKKLFSRARKIKYRNKQTFFKRRIFYTKLNRTKRRLMYYWKYIEQYVLGLTGLQETILVDELIPIISKIGKKVFSFYFDFYLKLDTSYNKLQKRFFIPNIKNYDYKEIIKKENFIEKHPIEYVKFISGTFCGFSQIQSPTFFARLPNEFIVACLYLDKTKMKEHREVVMSKIQKTLEKRNVIYAKNVVDILNKNFVRNILCFFVHYMNDSINNYFDKFVQFLKMLQSCKSNKTFNVTALEKIVDWRYNSELHFPEMVEISMRMYLFDHAKYFFKMCSRKLDVLNSIANNTFDYDVSRDTFKAGKMFLYFFKMMDKLDQISFMKNNFKTFIFCLMEQESLHNYCKEYIEEYYHFFYCIHEYVYFPYHSISLLYLLYNLHRKRNRCRCLKKIVMGHCKSLEQLKSRDVYVFNFLLE